MTPRRPARPPADAVRLPLLPRRNSLAFPRVLVPLLAQRPRSVEAIERALRDGLSLAIALQHDPDAATPRAEDLAPLAVEVRVSRRNRIPGGGVQAWVEGVSLLEIDAVEDQDGLLWATARRRSLPLEDAVRTEALCREVTVAWEDLLRGNGDPAADGWSSTLPEDDPEELAWSVLAGLAFPARQKQAFLEATSLDGLLEQLHDAIQRELEVLRVQDELRQHGREMAESLDRRAILQQELDALRGELATLDPTASEAAGLRERIVTAGMPEATQARCLAELERLEQMPPLAPEAGIVRAWLDWVLDLPWSQATTDNLDLRRAARVLDANHHGLDKVKQRILEHIAVRKLTRNRMRSPILLFTGPPGVGKTSLGRSIAEALGRSFVRVSLGGIRDEAEIRGHRRTYVGAMPGRILQGMRTAGSVNPLFMLDELDKLGRDFRGDPSAALLEVLDGGQNAGFSDHYLDVPYDLSRVMFLATANLVDQIHPAILDRMEIIEIPGYTEDEKLEIARAFLVPRLLKEHGLKPQQLTFTEGALRRVIRDYTHEAGVRALERELASICRKVAYRVATGVRTTGSVREASLERFLGPPRGQWGAAHERDESGVATGVARTEQGGDLLTIEVTLMDGKGGLTLTGQLGEVMRESAQAALSYTRSRAHSFNIPSNVFEKTDIHVHVPAGAIPKDGPSAGITIASAVISAFTRRPVRSDLVMTGEITLRGRILPVGGIKEKVLAAHRAGIATFVLPERNAKDLPEVPPEVRRKMRFVTVSHMDEVLAEALASQSTAGLLAV